MLSCSSHKVNLTFSLVDSLLFLMAFLHFNEPHYSDFSYHLENKLIDNNLLQLSGFIFPKVQNIGLVPLWNFPLDLISRNSLHCETEAATL